MPDEPIPNPSPSEPSGAGGNTSAEDDLDALLAEASSLVGDLTDEVGAPEESPASSQAPHPAGPGDNDAPGVDSQLAQLDGLLEDTDREIGDAAPATEAKAEPVPTGGPDAAVPDPSTSPAEAPLTDIDSQLAALDSLLDQAGVDEDADAPVDDTPDPAAYEASEPPSAPAPAVPDFMSEFTAPEASPEASAPPAAAGGADAVPDFMSEFTTPEAGPDASSKASEPPAATEEAAAVPDFMAEFTSPAPGTEGTGSAAPDTHPQTASGTTPKDVGDSHDRGVAAAREKRPLAKPPANLAGTIEELNKVRPAKLPTARLRAAARRLLTQIATRLTPLALRASERGVCVLEAIDRPTQRLGYRPRRLAGWLAVATIWASLIVYLSSLF